MAVGGEGTGSFYAHRSGVDSLKQLSADHSVAL